eukprot:3940643-Rhodomonas_salina.2
MRRTVCMTDVENRHRAHTAYASPGHRRANVCHARGSTSGAMVANVKLVPLMSRICTAKRQYVSTNGIAEDALHRYTPSRQYWASPGTQGGRYPLCWIIQRFWTKMKRCTGTTIRLHVSAAWHRTARVFAKTNVGQHSARTNCPEKEV